MHISLYINSHESKILKLPCSNLHFFQSLVYKLLPPDRAAFLHDQGYVIDNRPLKLFAMSWPISEKVPKLEDGLIKFDLPIRIVISTPITSTMDGIASGALMNEYMHIGSNVVFCEKVEVNYYNSVSDYIIIKTLSPISCYSQMLRSDGRKYTVYFSPFEKEFSNSIYNNLTRKYRAIYGTAEIPKGTVEVFPIGTPKERVAKFKVNDSFPIKGWSGRFKISGPKELLQVALDCGLGAKNSLGFGCIAPDGK